VLVISALKRAQNKQQRDKRPQRDDLRESGAIEYDADVILFIHHPTRKKDDPEDDTVEVIVDKQRNGPTGIAKVRFLREYSRFESISKHDDEENEGRQTALRGVP
jgi:replicative DNA helicase